MQPGAALVLFTSSYPFGNGEQFIETEILYLSQAFDNIVIVPNSISGFQRNVPSNVKIDGSLPVKQESKTWFYIKAVLFSLLSKSFYLEILSRPGVLFSYSSLYDLLACIAYALRTKSWVTRKCQERELNTSETIFYTYWLGAPTLGLVLAKKRNSKLIIISRAHGGDLYEERNTPAYLPCRTEILKGISRIYTISLDGYHYLAKKYPRSKVCRKVSRLGVQDPKFTTDCSNDDIFRVVSCSSLVPVKRISLLIKSLSELANSKTDKKIEWNHIGSGIQHHEMESFARSILPSNVVWKFHGLIDNKKVFEFYRTNTIDLFINLSESEGIPVSIMEAQSCGIPVITTAVGGTPEIVNDNNGILLPAAPTLKDVAQALRSFMGAEEDIRQKRTCSKENWHSKYNADTNYTEFSSELLKLLDS